MKRKAPRRFSVNSNGEVVASELWQQSKGKGSVEEAECAEVWAALADWDPLSLRSLSCTPRTPILRITAIP